MTLGRADGRIWWLRTGASGAWGSIWRGTLGAGGLLGLECGGDQIEGKPIASDDRGKGGGVSELVGLSTTGACA